MKLVNSELKITLAGVTETGLQLTGRDVILGRSKRHLKTHTPRCNQPCQIRSESYLKVLSPVLEGIKRYLQIMFRGMTSLFSLRL